MAAEEKNSSRESIYSLFAFGSGFGAVLSLSLTLLMLFFRQGMVLPGRLLVLCLSIFLGAIFSPFLIPGRLRAGSSRYGDLIFLLPVFVLLSPLLVFVAGPWFALLFPALALVALFRALPEIFRLGRKNLIFILVFAPVLALYLLLSVQSRQNGHLYFLECGAMGLAGLDNFFHTAICSMIQNFGKPSVGFDGLTPIRYHYGSHYWFAALGRAGGTMPLLSYSFGQMIVLVPGLIFGLVSSGLAVVRADKESFLKYTVLAVLLLAGLDLAGMNSHYISQSHTFALMIFLLSLPLLKEFLQPAPLKGAAGRFRFALALVLVAGMCAMKISVGAFFGAALFYGLLRSSGFSLKSFLALSAVALVVFAALAFFSPWTVGQFWAMTGENGTQGLFSYYRSLRLLAFSSFIAPVSFLAGVILGDKLYRRGSLMEALAGKRQLSAEMVLVLTALGAILTMILRPSDGWYFINVAQWFAMPWLLASVGTGKRIRGAFPPAALLSAFLLIAGFVALRPWIRPVGNYRNLALTIDRRAIKIFLKNHLDHPGDPFCGSMATTGKLDSGIKDALLASSILKPVAEKGRDGLAVFVPPGNERFWGITPGCYTVPFFVPAVAGVPMLKGIPPKNYGCAILKSTYGYVDYGEDSRSSDMTEKELCDYARTKGIQKVFVLNDLQDQSKNKLLDCP